MRSLAPAVIVGGAAFLASCAESEDPQTDVVVTETGDRSAVYQAPPDSLRDFTVSFDLSSPDCERPTLGFRALAFYVDDGSPVASVSCRIELDDGAVLHDCEGTHTFVQGGIHQMSFSVRDNASGTTVASPEPESFFVEDPLQLSVRAEAPACGLEFTYTPEIVGDLDSLVTLITPAENVVDASTRRVIVSAPGTYTVTLHAEQERVGPICSYDATTTVEVRACHDHTPDCDH